MSTGKKNIVYLTGFMGSGKSTIGPLLANVLGYEFLDIDAAIELRAGKSVTEIFERHGEGYFRETERTVLLETSRRRGCVVSLGGGTLAQAGNLQMVKSSGILVYLKTHPDHIHRRMRNKTNRPLLRDAEGERPSDEVLSERIRALLAEREPFYSQADLVVRTDDKPMRYTVDEIVQIVRRYVE